MEETEQMHLDQNDRQHLKEVAMDRWCPLQLKWQQQALVKTKAFFSGSVF